MGERKKKPRRKLKEGCQDTEQVESMTLCLLYPEKTPLCVVSWWCSSLAKHFNS